LGDVIGEVRRKFFATIDQKVLTNILKQYIADEDTMWLLGRVIDSFQTGNNKKVGLPLGNVTSQLLINIYMNEFDQFLKRNLKIRYYIRYADDFLILDTNKSYFSSLIPKIAEYLGNELKLSLHPDKVYIKAFSSGVDFLGWVHFPHHRTLRSTAKRRMFRKLKQKYTNETLASYLGMLKHGNTYKLIKRINVKNYQ